MSDDLPTRCAFDRKALEKPEEKARGVCPTCWTAIGGKKAVASPNREQIQVVLAESPEVLRDEWTALGDLTKPAVASKAMDLGLLDAAEAVSFGADSWEVVAEKVDPAKQRVSAVYNMAKALGFDAVANRLLSFHFPSDKLIRFKDVGRGAYDVHTPFNDAWNVWTRANSAMFLEKPRKEGNFWWRRFHKGHFRDIVNALQGIFGGVYALGPGGIIFPLPSMPLPKEDDFGKAPQGKPRATGVGPTVSSEILNIRVGDTIRLPGGGSSVVRSVDPAKKHIGVSEGADDPQTFHSFEAVETINSRGVLEHLAAEQRKAAQELGGTPLEIVKAFDRQIPVLPNGDTMQEYQIESLAFIERNRRVILAEEQGLGKTLTCIVAIDTPAIIVCPATLKANWVAEIQKWRPDLEPMVLDVGGGKPPKKAARDMARIFILNYEIVGKHLSWLLEIGAKTLIADEAQALKNLRVIWEKGQFIPAEKSPARANSFYELHRNIPKLVFSTGTPLMNRPKELFPLLHMCNKREWSNQRNFEEEYCDGHTENYKAVSVWSANGVTNPQQLHQALKKYMVRHTKAMVKLPPKVRQSIDVTLSDYWRREYLMIVRDFIKWVHGRHGSKKMAAANRAQALTMMTAMRHVAALGKVEAAVNWVTAFMESTGFRPLIVAGVHRDALDAIGMALSGINASIDDSIAKGELPVVSRKIRYKAILGNTSLPQRRKITEEFQKDGTIDVLLFSSPLGTGLTLTRSQDMLFIERMWRPSDQVQMEDRIHRLGQKNAVVITYMDAGGTIDQRIAMLLADKVDTISQVIDGIKLTDAQIMDHIFGDVRDENGKQIKLDLGAMPQNLGELIDMMEAEAASVEAELLELVRKREEIEAAEQKKMEAERGRIFDDSVLGERPKKKPTRNPDVIDDDFIEWFPGHAEIHAEYLRAKAENPDLDDFLHAMVLDGWDNPAKM